MAVTETAFREHRLTTSEQMALAVLAADLRAAREARGRAEAVVLDLADARRALDDIRGSVAKAALEGRRSEHGSWRDYLALFAKVWAASFEAADEMRRSQEVEEQSRSRWVDEYVRLRGATRSAACRQSHRTAGD